MATQIADDTKAKNFSAKKTGIITVYVPVNLINKVKNIVYWTPGLTITSFAETAIQKAVDGRKKNEGQLFLNVGKALVKTNWKFFCAARA